MRESRLQNEVDKNQLQLETMLELEKEIDSLKSQIVLEHVLMTHW